MPFRIEITDTTVHVFEQRVRTLKDEDTGEVIQVVDPPHASAIGLGDFTLIDQKTGAKTVDTDAFSAAVQAKVAAVCGQDLAAVVADKATATALIADAQAQAAQIIESARVSVSIDSVPVDAIAEPPVRA